MHWQYVNVGAGDLCPENLTANERYSITKEFTQKIETELRKNLSEGYELVLTGSAGMSFPSLLSGMLAHSRSQQINILCGNHEYPHFIEYIEGVSRVQIMEFDIHKSVDENLSSLPTIDICLISEVTHDFGFVINMAEFTQRLREHSPNVVVIGDSAQSVGIMDLQYALYDFTLLSFHKWLGFPWGTGCVIFRKNSQKLYENILQSISLQPGCHLNELRYLQGKLLMLKHKIFKEPIGKENVQDICERAALRFIDESEFSCNLCLYKDKFSDLERLFAIIRISDDFDGYQYYLDLLSKGIAIKYFSNMFDGHECFSGYRITSKGA